MRADRGGATVAIAAISSGVILVSLGLASVAALARVHAVVDSAADLAALAAANQLLFSADPCSVARDVARRNQVSLDRCVITGARVAVAVSRVLPVGIATLTQNRAVGHAYAQLQPDSRASR